MTYDTKRIFATLFAAVMVVSMFAPTAGAAAVVGSTSGDAIDVDTADIETDVQIDADETSVVEEKAETDGADADGSPYDSAEADDRVAPALQDATGETTVLVSVERQVGPLSAMDADDAIDTLMDDTERTQEPVRSALENEFDAEIRNSFWAGNLISAEVDLDTVEAKDLAGIEGVTRVSPNLEYERPAPSQTDAAAPDLDGEFTFGLEQINVPEFDEDFDGMGDGATVMVGDDGISNPEAGHPDLEFALEAVVEDGTIEEGTLVGGEEGSHGEHVSGTATGAADPAGDVPRYGVAPNADLLKADVFAGGAFTEDIIASMEWAAENDADVASFSLGVPPSGSDSTFAPAYLETIEDVNAAGTAAVVSAGNSGSGDAGGPVTTPATNFNSVAIGASDEAGDIAAFSSGAVIDDQSVEFVGDGEYPDTFPDVYVQPDVSAPGADVLSSGPLGGDVGDPEATYSFASGTSMAAPHYAGAIALLQSATDEDLDNSVIEAALAETAEKPDNEFEELNSRDIRFGTGIIDVHAAAEALDERQTIDGTVTDADGEPIVGATVETEAGALTATDEDGEFVLQTTNDPATVTADAPGVSAETVSVEGGDAVDFQLTPELDVGLIEGQPATLEAGEEFEIVAEVANLDQLTIELTDDSTTSAEDLTLSIGGDEIELGEPVETDGLSGEVAILVAVDEAAVDTEFSLEHTFERFGEDPDDTVFEVSDLDAPATAEPGDEIDVSATITNTGDDAGTQTVEFVFDGDTVADEEVSLDADESADVTFNDIPLPDAEGEFEHGVFTDDDSETATITVEEVDAEATVTFDEEEVVFAPDTTKAVPVQTDAADVAGYQVTVEFDPSVLQIDSVTTGDLGNGPTTDIDNENGTVGFVDSQADGVDQPDLANVTFEFIGDAGDETDLAITDDGTTVTTADAEDLETVGQEVTWSGGQLGDVNADGEITPADAVLTQQFLAGEDPDGFLEELADVTQTGEVTVSDVLAIEELILDGDADIQSSAATDAQPADDGDEIVVETGPTEVVDEIEGPEFELTNLEQPETLEIDEDIVSEVDVTNVGDDTGSIEAIHGTDIDDSFVFIPAEIEDLELDPGETVTLEKNLGSFEDINDALGSGFEPGDDVLTGFQIGENLDPNTPPDPVVEQELAEEITIAGDGFEVSDLDAPAEADTGDEIDVNATITNTGVETETQTVEFVFDGDVVDDEELTLDPQEAETVEFTDVPLPDEADAYEHGVFTEDDSQTATILVGDVDITTVAVVDDFEQDDTFPDLTPGEDIAETLEGQLSDEFLIDVIEGDEYAGQDVAIVTNIDPSNTADFVDATDGDDVGVVYLDQWGDQSNAIPELSAETGDPAETFENDGFFGDAEPPVSYEIDADHPIFDGVGDEGDTVEIHDGIDADHSWFEGTDADVLAQVADDNGVAGDALAVDDDSNTVMASSLGYTAFAGNAEYTEDADAILANSVVYATPDDDGDETVGFEIADVDPSGDLEVDPGAELTIDTTVENTDNETDTQTVEFVFDGDVLASEEIELDAGEETTVEFNVTAPEAEGEYDWFVATEDDESPTWTLTVESEETPDATTVAIVDSDLDTETLRLELEERGLSDEEIEDTFDEFDPDEMNEFSQTVRDGLDDDEFEVVDISSEDLLDNTGHDVYVVSQFEEESDITEFQDEISDDTGVVYADAWGSFSTNSVSALVNEIGDPEDTQQSGAGAGDVVLEFTEDHPLFDGVGEAGDVVTHMDSFEGSQDRRWFSDYSGGDIIADVGLANDDTDGAAIGVSDDGDEVILASHARWSSSFTPDEAFTEESNQILFNAIEYVASDDGGDEVADSDDAESVAAAPLIA